MPSSVAYPFQYGFRHVARCGIMSTCGPVSKNTGPNNGTNWHVSEQKAVLSC